MSDQLEMFERFREPVVAPAARSSDPPSSKAAAERMRDSGKAKKHRELVADLVFRFPGRNSRELSKLTDEPALDYHEIARRLSEVEREGSIERRIDGKAPVTWWPKAETVEWIDS